MKPLLKKSKRSLFGIIYSRSTTRFPNRILYAVNHCYPFSSNGYAVRTHGVAAGLVKNGCHVIAASKLGLPWERTGFNEPNFKNCHLIDGVRYIHSFLAPLQGTVTEQQAKRAQCAVDTLVEQIRVFKPAAVMAASNWNNALPALQAAQITGLPFFYEVRGFWEISRSAREPEWKNSPAFLNEVKQETAIAKAANKVFTLNPFMRTELIKRGIDAKKIELVPNGFSGWMPTPLSPLDKSALGIKSQYTIGYIGSFNIYEGLEDAIEALALLRGEGIDVNLLLVGSGESLGFSDKNKCLTTLKYRALAEMLGVSDYLITPGRVDPEKAEAFYHLLDVVVIPRRPLEVCELVSPMKPLEAAAYGKCVLMSDVAPLAELAEFSPNFHYFKKGNAQSMANKLMQLLSLKSPIELNNQQCNKLQERTWAQNVLPIVNAMKNL